MAWPRHLRIRACMRLPDNTEHYQKHMRRHGNTQKEAQTAEEAFAPKSGVCASKSQNAWKRHCAVRCAFRGEAEGERGGLSAGGLTAKNGLICAYRARCSDGRGGAFFGSVSPGAAPW